MIQKFGTKPGEKYPKLSDRSDIIVMTDEAHRSQYDTLALNMRNALPKAAFIGFTGSPLMAGEEKTKEVFGDYVIQGKVRVFNRLLAYITAQTEVAELTFVGYPTRIPVIALVRFHLPVQAIEIDVRRE